MVATQGLNPCEPKTRAGSIPVARTNNKYIMAIVKPLNNISDLELLEDIFQETENHAYTNQLSGSKRLLSKYWDSPEIYKTISKIISPIVGYDDIFSYRFSEFKAPCMIHSDGRHYLSSRTYPDRWKKKANTTMLIPLSIAPVDGVSYTVLFDQYPTKFTSVFWREHALYGWDDNFDYTKTVGYTNKPFNKKHHEEFLSHENIDRLYGFSIHDVVKWEVGKAIFFESNRLHCSSTFNIDEKRCFQVKLYTDLFDSAPVVELADTLV